MKYFFAAIAVFLAASSYAQVSPKVTVQMNVSVNRFYGYAYQLDSNKYLYTEVHERRMESGRWLGSTVIYYNPSGMPLAFKVINFLQDPFLPLFRLDVSDSHYSDGISKITPKRIYVFRRKSRNVAVQRKAIRRTDNMVADAGLERFVDSHFKQLLERKRLTVHILMPGTLSLGTFMVSRLPNGVCRDRKVVRIKVERSSLLRLIVGNPMIFAFFPESHWLCEYRGVSELYDPRSHKHYRVRILYGGKRPPDVPKFLPPLNADRVND